MSRLFSWIKPNHQGLKVFIRGLVFLARGQVSFLKKGHERYRKALQMDKTDRLILQQLQENAAQPVADIARKVGLSVTPCWRRIQRMEESGTIRKRVALLDPQKLNVGMSVFVAIRTDQHNAEWLTAFATSVSSMPEVVEFYRMSGEVDYMLRVVVQDMAAYDAFYRKLISMVELTDVSSSFAMEQIKFTTALPLLNSSPDEGSDAS